jgi:hypothetical protein
MDPTVEGADDLDLVYKLAERGSFAYLDEVTSAYRLHDHNASRHTRRMASALDRAIDAHLQRALDAGGTEAAADLTALRNAAATARSGPAWRDWIGPCCPGALNLPAVSTATPSLRTCWWTTH